MTQFSLITGKLKPKARGILLVTTDPPVKFMRCVKCEFFKQKLENGNINKIRKNKEILSKNDLMSEC